MTRKVRVPVHRTSPPQSVLIDPAATAGAQIGVNLLDPDGNLVPWPIVAPASSDDASLTTTDDLDEGAWNFWFTDLRAQDAVGGILADSANVTLSYVSGTSITADLTDLPNSGAGTLQATTRDSKGRITGTRAATITGTAGRVTVAHGDASDGLPTIDLATVADVGGGTLQKTAFDAYGRKNGTSAATTSNLTEGDNLYFTDMRADARVAAGIAAHIAAPDPHPIYIDASDTIDGGNF